MFRSRISKDELEVNDLSIQLALAFGGDAVKKETTEDTDSADGGAKPVATGSASPEPVGAKPKLYNKPKRELTRRVPCQHFRYIMYKLELPIFQGSLLIQSIAFVHRSR